MSVVSNNQTKRSSSKTSGIRIPRTLTERMKKLITDLNNKPRGKTISYADLIEYSINLLSEEDLKAIQLSSYSNKDHFEVAYEEFCETHQGSSQDDFIGFMLQGLQNSRKPRATTTKKTKKGITEMDDSDISSTPTISLPSTDKAS